ncbi:MAG: sugar ABC transporter permease [Actinobacteria bacterium]|nr:sugar ABC transporter permease [Actinomycetota bacterium]
MKKNRKLKPIIIFFLAPALILYSWFLIVPILNSLRLSFYTGNLFKAEKFVGLANYIKLFTQSPFNERLIGAFVNNIKFFVVLCIVQNLTALILAIILTRKFKGSEFFRTIFFIPTTLSVLVVGFLFNLMLNPTWGFIDKILKAIGLEVLIRPWLGDPVTALPTISLIGSWQYIGIPLILFTAGIKGIDQEIFEAARVDGVSQIGLIRYITLPLLKPIIGVVIILTFIGNFTAFDIVYAVASTMGNPNYTTDIFGTFFYRTTFGRGTASFNPDPGLGAAIATIMFFVVFIGVILWLAIFRRKEEE